MYHHKSYDLHENWYNQHYPTRESKIDYYRNNKRKGKLSISHWLQQLFFECLDPLLESGSHHWLTVGDAYGYDAQYIISKGGSVLATDLNTDFLSIAREEEIITQYAAENAEKLSFPDGQFDYVLCKESYHHFPRPYAALYEMIRVAKKGIVIIEPQDPISKMPLLLFLVNLLPTGSSLVNKLWKNRFSFEPVGNFVYKVSEREFEKFAAGLNLPLVAFKKINPNFYFKGAENITAESVNSKFRSIRLKKQILDFLVKCKIIPGQVLSAVIFKQVPEAAVMRELEENGYHIVSIPENPFT